jgi:N-acyl-D-aspartate/D-glutamate deacylase
MPHPLEIVHDLPAGAKRIVQHADGFVSTIVAGEVVQEHGVDTGARPGRVVRSAP